MNIRSRFYSSGDASEPPVTRVSPTYKSRCTLGFAFVAALSLFGMGVSAHAQSVQVRTARGVATAKAGELLVKFGSAAPNSLTAIRSNIRDMRATAVSINRRIGASELQSFGSIGWQLVKLPKGMSLEEGIAFYQKQPGVADVEPNVERQLMAVPNDPSFGRQYGLEKIGAPMAWNKTTGSNTTIVAVIDSGVNYAHEDLLPNMWKNPKELVNGKDDDGNGYIDDIYGVDTGDKDGDPMDSNKHGSHCAGIIGAAGNNGTGIAGVNWNVKMMACKVLASDGRIATSSIIESLQYVVAMKARGNNIRVVNESLGGPTYTQAEKDAIDAAGNAGILIAAAAGNATTNNDAKPSYPASYDSPNIIAVAASGESDEVASFSNYGATSVDLAAPGVDIYSTIWPGGSAYGDLSGTSMATPMVAGAAALLSSFAPTQTPVALRKLLMDTVDPLPQWSGKVVSGGRMNLARALVAINPTGLPIVTSVSPNSVSNSLRPAVVVNFSKPMNPSSVQSNWSFSAPVTGTFVWSNNNQTVTWTPNANLVAGTLYEGRIKGTAVSAANLKLDGNLSGTSTGSPDDDATWNFRIAGAPSNDHFARAMPLAGDSGSVPSFNIGATREAGEPRHGNYYGQGDKSVWFKWTAPATGNLILNTTGSTLSHVIGVYTGSAVSGLTTQVLGDSDFTGREALVQLRVIAGTTYSIAVDGTYYPPTDYTPAFTDTGNIRLSWLLHRSPSNDLYANAQGITGVRGSATGNTLGAYWEAGQSDHIGAHSSVWFKWTAPANGAVTFDTIGSNFDTALAAFTGTSMGSAQMVAQDKDGGGAGGTSLMPFTVSTGTTYYISVGGAGRAFYDSRGDVKLNWNFVNAPSNNSFATPVVLSPANAGNLVGSTMGATLETGEPEVDYDEGVASIWYSWTAPSSGALTIDTLGSSFDTNLGVFTGSTITGLTSVAENDDNKSIEDEKTSKVKFTAVKGVTYRIRIDSPAYISDEASVGYLSTHGTVRLAWSFVTAPSNDLFANAQILPGTNGGVTGSNVGANIEIDEPSPNYRDEGESIWYRWTAPANGAVMFDAAGSTYLNGSPMNTYMAVYTGTQLAGLELVDENDDDASNAPTETSRVRFAVRGGTTYYVRLDNDNYAYGDSGQGYDATHGSIALSWSFVGAPSNDLFANRTDLGSSASGRISGTTVGAGLEPNEDNPTYREEGQSIWYRWTAPFSGSTTFSTTGSKDLDGAAYDTFLSVHTATTVDDLEWVNENNDDGSLPTSKVTFNAEAGVTYIIRVESGYGASYDSVKEFNERHGVVHLSWSLAGAPISGPSIASFSPLSGKDGTVVTIRGTNLNGTTAVLFDGMTATFGNVTATGLTATAPVGVRTGRISVRTGNGVAISDVDFKVAPVISTFSPASGPVGTAVTIDGSGFSGVTSVTIGGVKAAFTIVSGTRLTAIVPAGAVSGKIVITTAGGIATSAGVFSLPPRIDSFTPSSGLVGTRVQIKGLNFLGTTAVLFNTTKAVAPTVTADVISVVVPAGATTGPISVTTAAGTTKTVTNFTVLTPPVVTGFTPAGGKPGTRVTISGTNFLGATAVRFNGIAAVNPSVTATSIVALVPATATTGQISVTTPQGEGKSAASFVVDGTAPTVAITNPVAGAQLPALPRTFTGTVNDNSGVANVQSLTWTLSRSVSTAPFWNATTGTWGALVNNATTPVRPSSYTTWSTVGTLPSGTNLAVGAYTLRVTATDKWGNVFVATSAFSVQAASYSVAGRITLGTAGLAGVTVTRTGGLKVVTNANGDYIFTGIAPNTSVVLTPTLTGHTFNPVSRTVGVASANVVGQNFAATRTTASYSIAGRVTLGTAGLAGVTVTRTGGVKVVTNTNGDYLFTGIAGNTSVVLTPTLAGHSFNPVSRTVGVTTANVVGQNFAATKLIPAITSFSPASGPVGTSVTINGTNLADATSVRFGAVAAVITSKAATRVVATVPTGATTGAITVITPGGTATSATAFTVTAATPDTTAPVVAFNTPAAGATYPSLASVTGTASDVGTGVKGVYLQLYRANADGTALVAVYDWTTGTWGTDDSLDSTIAVATGTTSWQRALPALPAGIYEIYVTGLDNATPTANQSQWIGRRFRISGAGITSSAGAS